MQYKALAVDIDGTLQCAAQRQLSPATLAALRGLQRRDIPVIVASGRGPFLVTTDILTGFEADYRVCANGACILDRDGNPLQQNHIQPAEVEALTAFAQKHRASISFSFDDAYYTYAMEPEELEKWKASHAVAFMRLCPKRDRHQQSLPYNAYCHMTAEAAAALETHVPGMKAMESAPGAYDICHAQVDKATAIAELLARLGLDFSQLVAIGDSENDLGMLQAAGMGVAMGNAPPHVKAAANHVTGDVLHDGVATAIHRFFPQVEQAV